MRKAPAFCVPCTHVGTLGGVHERRVRKCKRPSGSGLWGAYEIGRDEHGTWLYTPERSRYVGTGPDGAVGECFAGRPDEPGLHVLQLVPAGNAWWYAHWKHLGGQRTFSVDVCTPAVLEGDDWSYVDLELDLIRWSPDEPVIVDDEDEFEQAVALGHITSAECDVALGTVRELTQRLRADDELFDRLAWRRLADASARGLEPITRLR